MIGPNDCLTPINTANTSSTANTGNTVGTYNPINLGIIPRVFQAISSYSTNIHIQV